jgi:hypothetical protein
MNVYVSQIINKWKKLKKVIRKWLTATQKLEMNPSVVTASTRVEA